MERSCLVRWRTACRFGARQRRPCDFAWPDASRSRQLDELRLLRYRDNGGSGTASTRSYISRQSGPITISMRSIASRRARVFCRMWFLIRALCAQMAYPLRGWSMRGFRRTTRWFWLFDESCCHGPLRFSSATTPFALMRRCSGTLFFRLFNQLISQAITAIAVRTFWAW
jgi:hypothetical protein